MDIGRQILLDRSLMGRKIKMILGVNTVLRYISKTTAYQNAPTLIVSDLNMTEDLLMFSSLLDVLFCAAL